MADAERPTLPTPIENLLPLALRRVFMTDALVNAIFHAAARSNTTREAALIKAVAMLSDDRQRLQQELIRVVRMQPPGRLVIKDGILVPESSAEGPPPGPEHQPLTASGAPETASDALQRHMQLRDFAERIVHGAPDPAPQVPTDTGTPVPTDLPRDWFFTFGSGHSYRGESLARRFVRFHGTGLEARGKMYEVFGTAWSHQYATEKEAGVEEFGLTELKLAPQHAALAEHPFDRIEWEVEP